MEFLQGPLETYEDVRAFLDRCALRLRPASQPHLSPGERLERTKRFLESLGNPQERLKVIHVAGTTGKGSTSAYIETILRAHGFTTGLSVSPHAIDLRERWQLSGTFPDEEQIILWVQRVRDALLKMVADPIGLPIFFDLLLAIGWCLFADAGVDYAVIETGVGGRFDPSNAMIRKDKYCVITKIGFDHQVLLGNTLEEIAWQKIGIIQPGMSVVIGRQELISQERLRELAVEAGAVEIRCVSQDENALLMSDRLRLPVPYLAENAQTAHLVCKALAKRDGWSFDEVKTERTIQNCALPLRFERITWQGKTIIFDAAHNPQKMIGLVQALKRCYPEDQVAAVIALNPGTALKETIAPLVGSISRAACVDLIVGQGEYRFRFINQTEVARELRQLAHELSISEFTDLPAVLVWLKQVPEQIVAITGSFHFAALLRAHLLGLPEPW